MSKPPVERPVFIVGVHRSGTTLLRYMLNSSPRIYIPPESDFIPRFFGRDPEEELSEARISNLLGIIFSEYRLVKEWRGDPPTVREFIEHMPGCTPAAFLEALYGMYARQNGAVRWGDKTPIYASYIDLIHHIFPQAQFVHIIRDGRDVALSMLDKWGHELHIDMFFTARNWVRRIRRAQASGAWLERELYYELRYEDLVREPERQLQLLCEFLGERYVPQMGEPQRLGRQQIPPGDFHAPIRQPPSTTQIGRWEQQMLESDQRLFQQVAGSLLTELGYETVDLGPMSLRERLRFTALGAKYAFLQTGRRVAQGLGLVPPI
jgi:hypothetical protein